MMRHETTEAGKGYEIIDRLMIWHPDQFDDEPPIPEIRLPLRIKLKRLLELGETIGSNDQMRQLIAIVAPKQIESVDEMDINDFQSMFLTWQAEYNNVTGASLGESSASSASSGSIETQSSMTGGADSMPAF